MKIYAHRTRRADAAHASTVVGLLLDDPAEEPVGVLVAYATIEPGLSRVREIDTTPSTVTFVTSKCAVRITAYWCVSLRIPQSHTLDPAPGQGVASRMTCV